MSDTALAKEPAETKQNPMKPSPGSGGAGAVYALGLIGAAVYYWRHSEQGGVEHARALGKALVWPAFVVYDLLEHLSDT